jgi:hypothetical protein
MGSDIYTESAVAIRLEDFFNRKEIKKKSVRNNIVKDIIDEIGNIPNELDLTRNAGNLKSGLLELISMDDGYENDRDHNDSILRIFCNHTGINFDNLVEFELRSFDNNREVGYDVDTDTVYIMFKPFGLFETKMTKKGKALAKTLGLEAITETTWTVHSY